MNSHIPMINIENDSSVREIEDLSVDEITEMLSKNKQRYKVNDNFLMRKVAGEYLLIPTGSAASSINGMISINESFHYIWKQFEEPHTIYEVITKARDEFEDETGKMEKDIYRFVIESVRLNFMKEVQEK